MSNKGYFVISLDFELLWGVHDHETSESFARQIDGARRVIPQLLELFDEFGIHATWGVVGMLMADSREDLFALRPKNEPTYTNTALSAYRYLDIVGADEHDDKAHFASSLVHLIDSYEHQEVASHTYSHYYCKEPGQTVEQFAEDLQLAQAVTEKAVGHKATSLIFPRNQYGDEYARVAASQGFTCVRGNPTSFAYNGRSLRQRCIRLIDTYINVCGMKCMRLSDCHKGSYIDIPASRFLRKYDTRLAIFEPMKVQCIKRQMRYAAKQGRVFHLWWHPHNISLHSDKSLQQIRSLLVYYKHLEEKYGMESLNMREISDVVLDA